MLLSDVFSAKSVAMNYTEAGSNLVPYLGEGLFPAQKKLGLDLKWIRGNKGLPVALAPSNFDAKSVLRSREGIKVTETEMPFFRESMLIKEADEQDMLRVQDAEDPYAIEVLNRVYNDAQTLIDGANVIPEIMRMQLLAPTVDGSPRINITADGVQYSYNYDPDGSYKTENYVALSGTAKWDAPDTADPMKDIENAINAVEAKTGTRPSILIVNNETMGYLKQNAKIKELIRGVNGVIPFVTTERINELFMTELGVSIVVYAKQYKDYAGTAQKFYPNGMATLIPDGALGSTWYGMTPEERTLMANGTADVSVVNTGVAVAVSVTNDPVNTKTTVSEICLPSFERMDETFAIKAY